MREHELINAVNSEMPISFSDVRFMDIDKFKVGDYLYFANMVMHRQIVRSVEMDTEGVTTIVFSNHLDLVRTTAIVDAGGYVLSAKFEATAHDGA